MASIDIAKSFHRQFSGPIDSTYVFKTLNDEGLLVYTETVNGEEVTTTFSSAEELAKYYATRKIAYSGQIFCVLNPDTEEYNAYCVAGSDDYPDQRTVLLCSNFSVTTKTIDEVDEIPLSE